MIHDAAIPHGIEPATATAEQAGVCHAAARWTPADLQRLAETMIARAPERFAALTDEQILDAWCETVEAFRHPDTTERQNLDPALVRLCQLSPAAMEAGLEAVLGGVSRGPAENLMAEAEEWRTADDPQRLLLVSLASNLPGLAVQSLLPALLLKRPVILKSPSSEPLFAPAFVSNLVSRLPPLGECLAAITWKGGDVSLEAPLLEAADRILAYGEAASVTALTDRAGDKVFAYGPKTSLAVVASDVEPREIAQGLARDIALFDQRGCLSIQAVFTDGETASLADRLGVELAALAERWPQGTIDPVAAASVQQIRGEAALRGLTAIRLPLASGTIVVEPEPRFLPSPGLRTVRIHPLSTIESLPEILAEWSGSLQGAALAGDAAWRLQTRLESLGVTRFAVPGDLQSPDVSWHNGGVHPFTALTGRSI